MYGYLFFYFIFLLKHFLPGRPNLQRYDCTNHKAQYFPREKAVFFKKTKKQSKNKTPPDSIPTNTGLSPRRLPLTYRVPAVAGDKEQTGSTPECLRVFRTNDAVRPPSLAGTPSENNSCCWLQGVLGGKGRAGQQNVGG